MKLFAIRHAKPLVDAGVCYGQLDMPADEQSTCDAADALAEFLPPDIVVYVSPLDRCAALARQLQQSRPDLRFREDERIKEMNFGEWEGRLWSDISPENIEAWTSDFARFKTIGGESTLEFVSRVHDALSACRAAHPDDSVAWITHAGVIRSLQLIHASGANEASIEYATQSADRWPKSNLPFGSCTTIDFTAWT